MIARGTLPNSRRLVGWCCSNANAAQAHLRRHVQCSSTASVSVVAPSLNDHAGQYRRNFLSLPRHSSIPSITVMSTPTHHLYNKLRIDWSSSVVIGGLGTRCFSSIGLKYSTPRRSAIIANLDSNTKWMTAAIIKRDFASSGNKKGTTTKTDSYYNNTHKALGEIHNYVRNHLSLDIWTVNLLLLTFIIGPAVWNSMKNSSNTEHEIPVDDPVEHSVQILMDSTRRSHSDQAMQSSSSARNVTIISPEEDARRILNDLLASENVRTRASRIASGVIESPPFQNACKKLVKNVWDELVNDPETTSQLTMLVYTVLQNEKVYAAVKDLMLQLVNDEEVYKELTKLMVKLGEEQEVLDATQQLMTKSAHRTLNDPSVLDHSMEFATEVVGDDVVQRTGGEALRNTVGYAVQPSGGAVVMGIGTMIAAGVLHFYLTRRGGGDGGGDNGSLWNDSMHSLERGMNNSITSLQQLSSQAFDISPTKNINRGEFARYPSSENHPITTFIHKAIDAVQKIVHFPSVLLGSIQTSIIHIITFPAYVSEKCLAGWEGFGSMILNGRIFVFGTPSRIVSSVMASAVSSSRWLSNNVWELFCSCQSVIAKGFQVMVGNIRCAPSYIKDSWFQFVVMFTDYVYRMMGNTQSPTL